MSTNCIRCVRNKRTGPDLLCDECRISRAVPFVTHAAMLTKKVAELEERLKSDGQVGDRITELEQECAIRKEANEILRSDHEAAMKAARQAVIDECCKAIRASCLACGGTGGQWGSAPPVTRDMAIDAGDLSLEGSPGGPDQSCECEYCGRPIKTLRALAPPPPTDRRQA